MQKKVTIIIVILCLLGGGLVVGKMVYNKNFANINREKIEQNVRNYIRQYKLDPDKVVIENIGNPKRYPMGEREFLIYIKYTGQPYLSMSLTGNPDTLGVSEPKETIIVRLFNELYLEERYEEFKPAIDYLSGLGITDPLRPEGTKMKYFQTSVGVDPEINGELRKAFWQDETLDGLKQYIKDNKEKISELDTNVQIVGLKEGVDEQQANEMLEHLKYLLPKTNYDIEIGVDDPETGIGTGLYDYLELK